MKTGRKFCAVLFFAISPSLRAAEKTFIDYFLPTPMIGSLSTNEWGAPEVLPRDAKCCSGSRANAHGPRRRKFTDRDSATPADFRSYTYVVDEYNRYFLNQL